MTHMSALPRWSVNRPGPLTPRAPGLWTVDDFVPGRPIPRRMTVVQRDDGLLFFNAIPVPDETLAAIRALGAPRHLLVPNEFHALQAAAFAERLQLETWAHPVSLAALSGRLVAKDVAGLPPQPGHRLFTVEGFRTREQVLVVHDTVIAADLFTNVPHAWTLSGLAMRLFGFSGPAPKLPFPVRRRVGRDFAKVKALLEELAALGVTQLIPSHGAVLERHGADALRRIANSL
jgi:hypothetical protein